MKKNNKQTTTTKKEETNERTNDKITKEIKNEEHKESGEQGKEGRKTCIAFDIKFHFRMSENCVWHLSNYYSFFSMQSVWLHATCVQ